MDNRPELPGGQQSPLKLNPEPVTQLEEEQRHIKIPGAIALYVASVLGGGILVLPGLTANVAGAGALIAWVAASLVSLPIALIFARLSSIIPDAGGVSTFVRRAYGDQVGDIAGWIYLWIIPVGQPAVVLSGLYYAQFALHLSKDATFACAWIVLAGAATLNIRGTRMSAQAQSIVTFTIILILIAVVVVSAPHASVGAFHPFLPHGVWAIGSAAALIMWAYVGWENVSFIAEDFRNPRRDFMLSMSLSVVIVGGLYTLVTTAVLWVIPKSQIGTAKAPLAEVLERAISPWAANVAAILSLLIISASALAFVWGGSSLAASLARAGSLPGRLAQRNKRGSYRNGVLCLISAHTAVLSMLYAGWLDLDSAARIVGVSAVATYALCAIAYLKLMKPVTLATIIPALITLIFCACVLPFFGIWLVYPIIVSAICYATHLARKRSIDRRKQS